MDVGNQNLFSVFDPTIPRRNTGIGAKVHLLAGKLSLLPAAFHDLLVVRIQPNGTWLRRVQIAEQIRDHGFNDIGVGFKFLKDNLAGGRNRQLDGK